MEVERGRFVFIDLYSKVNQKSRGENITLPCDHLLTGLLFTCQVVRVGHLDHVGVVVVQNSVLRRMRGIWIEGSYSSVMRSSLLRENICVPWPRLLLLRYLLPT
jgi:hypothetical protein